MFGLAFAAATGYVSFGIIIGLLIGERLWWLLSRPLPRPWRAAWRYLAPGTLLADIRRLLETGRWT